jgi:hypothetical protein
MVDSIPKANAISFATGGVVIMAIAFCASGTTM